MNSNLTAGGLPEGNAIVYCQGAFNTPNGKTAHGLVRFTRRYRVLAVVDARWAGRDAGAVLDGRPCGIAVCDSVDQAVDRLRGSGTQATHLVMGLAPDGGRLDADARAAAGRALAMGLCVDSGLHDFIGDDPDLSALARKTGAVIRDVRRPPERSALHFFSGKIESVSAFRIAVLGTDSAVGKRTTAWLLVQALEKRGIRAEMIGTGQTAWMQGARYSLILDALVNDFVSGEIEHAVWSAWDQQRPDVIVVEGQGSLMNPAYPGGFEILAAARPQAVILQHAPARRDYDGFPGYPLHPLKRQIEAVALLSGRPVAAVTVNHEGMDAKEIPAACQEITRQTGLPAVDVLADGAEGLAGGIEILVARHKGKERPA